MERISVSRQNLDEFLKMPFGKPNNQKNLQYESRYRDYRKNNKIQVAGTTVVDETYFIHIKVPSESQKGLSYYDVVVMFFTPHEEFIKELTLKNYYIQLFSNSPGFVYKYSALYHLEGYLISSLQDKFTPGMLDVLPDKANKSYELFYDSSIYYACRFLQDNRMNLMAKLPLKIYKRKSMEVFLRDIQDVESSEISRSVSTLQRSVMAEIKSEKKLSRQQETKLSNAADVFRKQIATKRKASKSTFSEDPGITRRTKITGSKKSKVTRTKSTRGS